MTFFYDIHSILSVASEVSLPELAAFAAPAAGDRATVRVRVRGHRPGEGASRSGERFAFDDGLGRLGFSVRVALGERIDVEASPLLRRSPHVLYTNVVEPILRWTFVREGWALVRGACVARGPNAFLITAPTDVCKTTTVLTLLRRYPRLAFLSDDLCLVRPNGMVLSYPKPMTISRHTLRSITPRALSARARAALVVQSPVHSRSGRRFAQALARTGLPVATIHTLMQWVIPPPKYPVRRLLPYAELAAGARLRRLYLIERAACDEALEVGHDTAMQMLADNCEDAFGFPPYSALVARLRYRGGQDLRVREREIVAGAFAGQTATVLGSSRFDWWRRIAADIEHPAPCPRRSAIAVASVS